VLILAVLLPLPLTACYHMRAVAEKIESPVLTVGQSPAEALRRIRKLLEDERQLRIIAEESNGATLITAPWHFSTDTGFGQPAGGRKYYTQLQVTVSVTDGRTTVTLSPHNYEIRSSYAYGLDGQVMTMNKHYPYEEYPGMFDNNRLTAELKEVSDAIARTCNE